MPELPLDRSREARFTDLYDAHYHRILGYAGRRAARDDAFDVVAETFAVAWRRLDDVPHGERALCWLYGTARRVLANQRRAARRRADLAVALEHEPLPAPASVASGDAGRVAAALAGLTEDERELLLLFAWEGLDAAAVGSVLGCSPTAARIRLHRARRRFASALAAIDAEATQPGRRGPSATAGRPAGPLNLEDTQ